MLYLHMSSSRTLSNDVQKLDLDCILLRQHAKSRSLPKGRVDTDDIGLAAFHKYFPKQVVCVY